MRSRCAAPVSKRCANHSRAWTYVVFSSVDGPTRVPIALLAAGLSWVDRRSSPLARAGNWCRYVVLTIRRD